MSEEVTLSGWVANKANAWNETVGGKTIDELGGTNAALLTTMNEISLNIWPTIYSIALAIEEIASVYNNHVTESDAKFNVIVSIINSLKTSIEKQDSALVENVNRSLQALNKQMTNQNKVLDKQVIKLAKSVSKITGE